MLAATYSHYGPPEQLELKEVVTPKPGDDDVLVRVAATSLNASDLEFLSARPAYVRAWGLWRPRYPILGSDVAGKVEAVGRNVVGFEPGDHVFGDLFERWGGLAQYIVAPAKFWAHIPDGLSFEQACMVPQAGVVALQAVQAAGELAGKSVLINGAGGGSGTFAIQLAKSFGAKHVVAVDRADKAELMKQLGADVTVDFEREDYTKQSSRFDLIVDFVGSRSLGDNARSLSGTGQYFIVGGPVPRLLQTAIWGAIRSLFSSRKYRVLVVKQSLSQFTHVARLCADGQLRPVLGRTYPLTEVRAAFRSLAAGEVLGKVVVTP